MLLEEIAGSLIAVAGVCDIIAGYNNSPFGLLWVIGDVYPV